MDIIVPHQIVHNWVTYDLPVRLIELTSSLALANDNWSCPRPFVYFPFPAFLNVSKLASLYHSQPGLRTSWGSRFIFLQYRTFNDQRNIIKHVYKLRILNLSRPKLIWAHYPNSEGPHRKFFQIIVTALYYFLTKTTIVNQLVRSLRIECYNIGLIDGF